MKLIQVYDRQMKRLHFKLKLEVVEMFTLKSLLVQVLSICKESDLPTGQHAFVKELEILLRDEFDKEV